MNGSLRSRYIICFLIVCFGFSIQAEAARRKGRASKAAVLYAEPDSGSVRLGAYPAGSPVLVETPSRKGWLQVYFSRPYKGHSSAWVREDAIELAVAKPSGSVPAARPRAVAHWVGLSYGLLSSKPTAYQNALGSAVQALSVKDYQLEYGLPVGSSFDLGMGLGMCSFDNGVSSGGGYLMSAHGRASPFHYKNFSLGLGAGAGISLMHVTSHSTGRSVTVSNMLNPFFMASASARQILSRSIGLEVDLGYVVHSIKNLTVIDLPQTTVADLSLSGMQFSGGFLYFF